MKSIAGSSHSGNLADVNKLLHHIARWGQTGVPVASLLERGANINSQDVAGDTPLHIAAMFDQLSVLTILARCGADKTIKNNGGFTPLECVERWQAAHILLFEGELLPMSDPSIEGALYWAIHSDNIRLVIYLMNLFKTWKPGYEFGPPLLSYALREYSLRSIRYFLKAAGEPLTYRDEDLNTLLHYAAGSGDSCDIPMLIDRGCDVNARNVAGETPMMIAARKKKVYMVRALAEAGARANIRNYKLEMPIHVALQGVSDLNSEYTTQTVRELIVQGCDSNARDRSGRTPLHQHI